MAPESDPRESGRSDTPLLDDDSAGPLAELLFSSPVSDANNSASDDDDAEASTAADATTLDDIRRTFEGIVEGGRHDVDAVSPPSHPSPPTVEIPPIDDVVGIGDLRKSTSPSRAHTAERDEGTADELGALFLPLDPEPVTDRAVADDEPEPAPVAPIDDEVPPEAPDASRETPPRPVIQSVPVTQPSPAATGPAKRLMFSTETVPGVMERSTVVNQPATSLSPREHPPPPEGRSLFVEDGADPGVARARLGFGQAPPSPGNFIPTALLDAADRRWFWRAVAGAVVVTCATVGFVVLTGDGTETEADTALGTSIVAAQSSTTVVEQTSLVDTQPLAPTASSEPAPPPTLGPTSSSASTVEATARRATRSRSRGTARSTTAAEGSTTVDPAAGFSSSGTDSVVDPTTSSTTGPSTTQLQTTTTLQLGPPTVPPTTSGPTTTQPSTTTTVQVGPPTVPPTTPRPTTTQPPTTESQTTTTGDQTTTTESQTTTTESQTTTTEDQTTTTEDQTTTTEDQTTTTEDQTTTTEDQTTTTEDQTTTTEDQTTTAPGGSSSSPSSSAPEATEPTLPDSSSPPTGQDEPPTPPPPTANIG